MVSGVHIPMEMRATAVLYHKMGGCTPKQSCMRTQLLFKNIYPDIEMNPNYMCLWEKSWGEESIQWVHEEAVRDYLASAAKLELDKIVQHLRASACQDESYAQLFRAFLAGVKYLEERSLTKEQEKQAVANPVGFISGWINRQVKRDQQKEAKEV